MAQPPPSTPCLRVLDTAVVTPSGPALPASSLPLTYLDLPWLRLPPVERLFLYRPAPDADIAGILAGLKGSLSTALRAFFPLAGHVRLTPGTASRRYDLFYQPGDGVAFTLAHYDADVHDLASDQPRQVAEMASLMPRLPGGGALLAVQATVLLKSRGLALGVTVHHVACDGAVSTSFLHTWAAACAGRESPTPLPVIDRTLIADPEDLYDHYIKNLPSTEGLEEFVKMSPDQLLATFTLSREHLQSVKDAVAGEAARRDRPPPRCTTLVAALGFMWSCCCRAKAEAGTDPTYFTAAVDLRPWMKPPVPATYLGNCIGAGIGAAPKEEVASAGAAGLLAACSAIAAGFEKALASPEWETLMERLKEVGARGVLSVAGSPRFHVYGLDFGFGRPAKVNIVSVARTGALAVADAREGGGGLELGISLPPAGMERFQMCFAEAMEWLSSQHN